VHVFDSPQSESDDKSNTCEPLTMGLTFIGAYEVEQSLFSSLFY